MKVLLDPKSIEREGEAPFIPDVSSASKKVSETGSTSTQKSVIKLCCKPELVKA